MIHKPKRLYEGNLVDLRSVDVEKYINNKENVIVDYDNKTMLLTPKDLIEKKTKISSKLYQSKHVPGQTYRLYSYKWEPKD